MIRSAMNEEARVARKLLLWLSFECPGRGNPAGCPLHSVRFLPFEDRRKLVERMESSELIRLYRRHASCGVSVGCGPGGENGIEPGRGSGTVGNSP